MFLELFPIALRVVPEGRRDYVLLRCRDISRTFASWSQVISDCHGVIKVNEEDIPSRNVKVCIWLHNKPYPRGIRGRNHVSFCVSQGGNKTGELDIVVPEMDPTESPLNYK